MPMSIKQNFSADALPDFRNLGVIKPKGMPTITTTHRENLTISTDPTRLDHEAIAELLSPEEVGKEAARRTVRKLGARKVPTCEAPGSVVAKKSRSPAAISPESTAVPILNWS